MILHAATAAAGNAVTPDCHRLVVCDRYGQPVAVFAEAGDQLMATFRGDKGFEDLVALTGIGQPARTVDVKFGG